MSEPELKPCVSCGKLTEWACADCMIDTRISVHICENPECRDKHEKSGNCTNPSAAARNRRAG
jgi:hypothetical protein